MNAIELASRMNENTHSISRLDAVAAGKMLRRQHNELTLMHEAIVKLREALVELKAHATQIDSKVGYLSTTRKREVSQIYNLAEKALKDTEDFK